MSEWRCRKELAHLSHFLFRGCSCLRNGWIASQVDVKLKLPLSCNVEMFRHRARRLIEQNSSRASVFAIIFVAVFLRIYGINYGLPFWYHPDEDALILRAIRMLQTGDFNPHWFNYPTFLMYIQAIAFSLYFPLAVSAGNLQPFIEKIFIPPYYVMAVKESAELAGFLLAARIVTVLLSVMTVLVVYLLASKLYGRETGTIGALLLAVSAIHVEHSHYAVTDVPATFFATASFFILAQGMSLSKRRYFLFAGLLAGLAMATKYNAIVFIFPLCLFVLFVRKPIWKGSVDAFTLFLSCCTGFLIGVPFVFLDTPTFLNGVAAEIWHYRTGHIGAEGTIFQNVSLYTAYLAWGFGPFVLLFSLLGIILGFYRNRRETFFLVFPAFVYGAALLNTKVNFVRNLVPLSPFIAILAAYFLWHILGSVLLARLGLPSLKRNIVFTVIILVIIVVPLYNTLTFDHIAAHPENDTRTIASKWIEANIPAGSRIAVEVWGPPVSYRRYNFSMTIWTYNYDYEWYISNGIEYAVFSSMLINLNDGTRAFHEQLFKSFLRNGGKLVVTFNPQERIWLPGGSGSFQQPSIFVYNLTALKPNSRVSTDSQVQTCQGTSSYSYIPAPARVNFFLHRSNFMCQGQRDLTFSPESL